MQITDIITITELARISGKSRPTLYKYINDWQNEIYADIPYLFIQLFSKISSGEFKKADIIYYCNDVFAMGKKTSPDTELEEIFELIKTNKNKINLSELKRKIQEDINNG